MIVAHLTETPLAYMPARFVDLINRYTPHQAVLIQQREFWFGNPLGVVAVNDRDMVYDWLKKADVLHFHGSRVFDRHRLICADGKILDLLEFYSKPYVLEYHGTPQRERPFKYQRYVPLLVSTPEMLELFPQATYFPNLIDETSQLYTKNSTLRENQTLKICHHYSMHKAVKDTDVFTRLSHRLAGKFEFELIPAIDLDKACVARSTADIVFDHLQGYYGLISLEGMAQGLCVINNCTPFVLARIIDFFGVPPPFFHAETALDLEEKLISTTKGQAWAYGALGYAYMRDVWSGKKQIHRLIEYYESLGGKTECHRAHGCTYRTQ